MAKGSYSQNFETRHELFLEETAKGRSLQEIQKELEISDNQLMRHLARAYQEQQERQAGYQTIPYKSLPKKVQNFFSIEENTNVAVRITAQDNNAVLLSIA